MDTESFIASIKNVVRDSSIIGVQENLQNPPGRSPDKMLAKLSIWYNSLSEVDREYIEEIIKLSVDSALFGFLSVFDGVRAFDSDSNEGTLEILYHLKGNTVSLSPNQNADYLHDIYNYDE